MKHLFRAAVAALLAFCALSGAAVAQEPSPTGDAVPAGPVERYFLLLFDSPLGGMRQLDEVSATVEEWLAQELLPTDAAAVVSYYGQELSVAQDFTRDRQALTAAVRAAVRGQAPPASVPAEAGCPSLMARLSAEQGLSHQAESFYGALQVLAETVDSVPGPKGLLVFSKGFGRSRQEPAISEALLPEGDLASVRSPESPVLDKYLPELSLYEPTLEALLSREIRLYPVDLATDYNEIFPLAGAMSRLAAATHGRYVYPATELPRALVQIAQADLPTGDRQAEALTPITVPIPSLSAGIQAE